MTRMISPFIIRNQNDRQRTLIVRKFCETDTKVIGAVRDLPGRLILHH